MRSREVLSRVPGSTRAHECWHHRDLGKSLFCKGFSVLTCKMGGWALNSPPHPDSLEYLQGGGWE